VIEDPNAEDFCGLNKLILSRQVCRTRLQIAGWVVVSKNDCRSAVSYNVGEDFARVDLAAIKQADSNNSSFD
jgi:hypothetical protein